mmetsp:Transcript_23034/g.22398  ORF Transcript_23034/g.22398 Transcript_23034/m.22398 type:complete len:170 (+) Transcript_23034:226-735(+)
MVRQMSKTSGLYKKFRSTFKGTGAYNSLFESIDGQIERFLEAKEGNYDNEDMEEEEECGEKEELDEEMDHQDYSDFEEEDSANHNDNSLQDIKEKPKVPLGMNKLNLEAVKPKNEEKENEDVPKKAPGGFNLDLSKAKNIKLQDQMENNQDSQGEYQMEDYKSGNLPPN